MITLETNFTTLITMIEDIKDIDFNPAFQKAVELIEKTDKHIFITGKAGVGKSTLLFYCQNHCPKNMVILAPTGVAALNVKGQTIHRFFGFPVNVSPEKILSGQIQPRAKRIYKNLQSIIIDEVSMLRADILDCIDSFLRLYGPQKDKAFGGVQMIFVGDLYQLPPVVSETEQNIFNQKYTSPYFFSAQSFMSISIEVVELTQIYRQQDEVFINILNAIRENKVTEKEFRLLNSRLTKQINEKEFYINLTTTNKLADNINQNKLQQLDGVLYKSQAIIDGAFNSEYYPTSEQLEFKLGAQIMFLNNDSKNRWVNGSLGHIEEIKISHDKPKYIRVRLQKDYKLVDVFPYSWEIYKYSLEDKEIISEVIGSFTQFPFRLAWAVTIHKSQGKTFDKINIDIGRGTFATGQLYVALSRCTTLNGISLSKPLHPSDVLTDYRINEFMQSYLPAKELSQHDKKSLILSAIPQRQKLQINYKKTDGSCSTRIIIPIRIQNTDTLLAFCTQRGQQRSFCISRIESIKTIKE